MSNYINKIILGAILLVVFNSCAKKLDLLPPSAIVAENFWKTEKDAWLGLNACYSQLPGWDGYIEMASDNAHSQKSWEGPYEAIQTDAISNADDMGYDFTTVRLTNNFLEKVDACKMDDNLRIRMKAEARFLRAFAYLRLTALFGKVPIITTVLPYDAPPVPRDPIEKVQKFILDDLSEIAEILPQEYDGSYIREKGRITRSGALALRSRAALYFNNFTEAEKSAGLIISEGHHSLFRITTLNAAQLKEANEMDQYIDFAARGINKDKFIKGMYSYESLWHAQNASPDNPEYVVTRGYIATESQSDFQRYTYIRPSQLVSGYSSFTPMQDLVDTYWDADGKTIRPLIAKDSRAANLKVINNEVTGLDQVGYIAKVATLNLKNYSYINEFRNRDSRLYASILFPFKGWHETDFSGPFYYQWNNAFYNNGNESMTGYSWRKITSLNSSFQPYAGEGWAAEDFPTIRYAEILLTYAEARIQIEGWDSKVQEALNNLRDRCGMPDVPQNMSSKQEALEFVRNERRIELAGEGNRFFDMRRYGDAYCAKVMNGETYAPNGEPVVNKQWSDRLLLMPIPQTAIDLNPLLKNDQNPGY